MKLSKKMNHRAIAGSAMALIVVSSFAWSLWESSANPTVAYFSTFSRAWEIGIGGLLACISGTLSRIPQRMRPMLAWVGFVGMVLSLFTTNTDVGFPGPGAILPTLSAAAIIAAGTGTSAITHLRPLTNKGMVYIGDISFSLYLWHFPIIVLATSFLTAVTPTSTISLLALVALVSVYSYHLFEDPIRKSSWLTGPSLKQNGSKTQARHNYLLVALSGFAVATVILSGLALLPPQRSTGEVAAIEAWNAKVIEPSATDSVEDATAGSAYGPQVSQLQMEIAQANIQTEWPTLTPSIDEVLHNNPEPEGVNQCGRQAVSMSDCVWGEADAPKRAVVVGDSIAIAWMPALIDLYGSGDWSLEMDARYGCPFTSRSSDDTDCVDHRNAVVQSLQTDSPDLLIVANNYPDSGDAKLWAGDLKRILAATTVSHIIVLGAPPHNADVRECYRPGSSPLDCSTTSTAWYQQLTYAEQQAIEELGGLYVDTVPLFCSDAKICPIFAGSTLAKVDSTHPSSYYVKKVTPALAELIAQVQHSP